MASRIALVPLNKLRQVVAKALTFKEILNFCGLEQIGSNSITLRSYLDKNKVDYSHIPRGLNANRGRTFYYPERLEDAAIFCENSKHSRQTARRRVIEGKIIPYKCEICGNTGRWRGKPLILRLDHKNGKRRDHRKENLRFVCPNCDTQLETYGSRNRSYPVV